MNTLEAIHSILSSLSKKEKEGFVATFTSSGNKQRYKDRLILLLEFENIKIVDTEIIKLAWSQKIQGPKNDRAFQNAQRNLLDDLLHYLIILNPYCQNHPFEKEMMYADKLVQLGLHDIAYQRFKEILVLLESHNNPHWQGVVLRKMHKIFSQLKELDINRDKEFDVIVNMEKSIVDRAVISTDIYHFKLNLGKSITAGWVLQTLTDKKEFVDWFSSKILTIDDRNLPLASFAYLTKAKTEAYRILMDYEKGFQSQLTLVRKLAINFEQLKIQKPELLFSEYLDLADLSYRTGRTGFAEEQLNFAEGCIPLINDNNSYRIASVLNIRCNMAYRYKNIEDLKEQATILSDAYINLFSNAPAQHVPIIIGTLLKSFLKLENYKLIDFWYNRIKERKDVVRKNNMFLVQIIYACSAYMPITPQFNIHKMALDPEFEVTIRNVNNSISHKNHKLFFEKLIIKKFLLLSNQKERVKHIEIFTDLLKELGNLPFNGYIYQEQIYEIFDIRNWIIEQITRLKKVSADS